MSELIPQLRAALGNTYIFAMGQAGYVFKSKRGTKVGIDLYLSDCVERYDGFKRLCPKVADAKDLDLDIIIATHWHLDHFDIDTIPIIMENSYTHLFAARDCKESVKKCNIDEDRVQYLAIGNKVIHNDIGITAVFCDHGESAPLAVGIVLSIDNYKIYITGDTCLRLDKAEEIAKLGPFDIMIAPINGAFGNLNEEECMRLTKFHKPKVVIPCHYWMFAEQHGDPGLFMDLMKEHIPRQKFFLLRPGENVTISSLINIRDEE